MIIKAFCFNPFYENTYLLYEEQGEAWIFDPGCSNVSEEHELGQFISEHGLDIKRLLLTHAHIDHILGLKFISDKYSLKAELHIGEVPVIEAATQVAMMYGMEYKTTMYNKDTYISDNQVIKFKNHEITCLWTPGHSPGSICFYIPSINSLIGGDVLFEGSIGRTDLPGGDYNTLINSIKSRLFPLRNDTFIYPGHGGITTIGQEKLTNPFLN